jgi:hypothetical protein
MGAPDDDFRDFVVAFSGPLTRLAYLLIARPSTDTNREPQRLAVAALAHTRRHWRTVHETGAPEPIAIEALLDRLPRRRRATSAATADGATTANAQLPVSALETAPSRPVAHGDQPSLPADPHAAFRRPGVWVNGAFSDDDANSSDERLADVDLPAVRAAMWRSWLALDSRHRVPLVFADPSVASRRLVGLDVPPGFASPHRLQILAEQGISQLHADLARDASVPRQFGVDGNEFRDVLAEVLEEQAQFAEAPLEAFSAVASEAARAGRRAGVAVAAVLAVLAAGILTMVNVSTSRDQKAKAAAASSIARSAAAKATASEAPSAGPIVNWPVRGELSANAQLLANVRTAFVADHPDAVGAVQILLATDTPWFRLVYATAQSQSGVVQSWFYGPIGATTLSEGAFSYGSAVSEHGVIADVLSDPQGHSVLVVIGPTDTTDVELGQANPYTVVNPYFQPLAHPQGVAVSDVSNTYVPSLVLQVVEGQSIRWGEQVPTVQLGRTLGGISARRPAAGTAGVSSPTTAASASAPSLRTPAGSSSPITIERGTADPTLLAGAEYIEQAWERTGELGASGDPEILWGGQDNSGTKILVMRVRTLHLADLVVVVWSDRPTADGEYLLAPDAPDYPLGFVYSSAAGSRVGVLVPRGVVSVELDVDGVVQSHAAVDTNGFASVPVTGQYGTLADQSFAVKMFDAAGRQVTSTSVPPAV